MSLCNSLAVTVRISFSGHAIGLIPAQIVRREIEAGIVRQVTVKPEPPQIRFHLCYRTGEFGPGVAAVLELARSLAREHRLFL
jgi:DNA-binding transcriptional LysR family regulator